MTGWTVMIPVKPVRAGKSRLAAGDEREELARALALDTIDAALSADGVAAVVVVTADADLPAVLPAGVAVVRERRAEGIDAALAKAARSVGEAAARASLPADLGALRPGELAAALRDAADWPRAVVADAEGTGTTLLTAAPGVPWRSAYGPHSFARHLALGCRALELPSDSGLRRDLDTPGQLAAASVRLGRRTAERSLASLARSA